MHSYQSHIQHKPTDFIYKLEDDITELISETDIYLPALESYCAWRGYKDKIEYDYDPEEAYPLQLEAFRHKLEKYGWYYTLCHGTQAANRWQKATKNKKLYNRIKKFINCLMETSF